MDQKALEVWLEESARRDEDMIALSKYMRQDEEKIKVFIKLREIVINIVFWYKELTLEIERLTKERDKRHKQLAAEATETQMAQVELDRIGEDFRQAHFDRQQLIKQWETTVHRMQQRDKEMEALAEVNASLIITFRAIKNYFHEGTTRRERHYGWPWSHIKRETPALG